MEDDLNGIQPQWKTTSMEDDLNGRVSQWRTTSMEDNLNRRDVTKLMFEYQREEKYLTNTKYF